MTRVPCVVNVQVSAFFGLINGRAAAISLRHFFWFQISLWIMVICRLINIRRGDMNKVQL